MGQLYREPRADDYAGVVNRCRRHLCGSMMVQGWGFPESGLLEGPELRSIPHITRNRRNMEVATRRGWNLHRLYEKIFRVASRALLQGRRMIVVVSKTARDWKWLWLSLESVF